MIRFAIRVITILILGASFSSVSYGAENVFYILHSNNAKQIQALHETLSRHKNSINILISQAYRVDDKGTVAGYVNQETVNFAKANSLKLMAMIVNEDFDQTKVHRFLSSKKAQERALKWILEACRKYQFYGVQFDFEMVSVKDKAALTQFFKIAAERLHKEGFAVSYAVVPSLSDKPGPSAFLRKTYQNWSGAYDLKALGASGDFVTVMAYNQHPEGTTPGPVASIQWVESAVVHALKYIPANKISLGIPVYSSYWYTGAANANSNKISTHRIEIAFRDASKLIDKYKSNVIWNDNDKVNYSIYQRNWLNEYIYLEDADSFKSKLQLVNQYHLRGISVFRIGTEDERIWALLTKKLPFIS